MTVGTSSLDDEKKRGSGDEADKGDDGMRIYRQTAGAESPYPLYLPISFKFFSATSVTFALKIFSRNTSNAME